MVLVKNWGQKETRKKKRPLIEAPKVRFFFEAFEPKSKPNCVESSETPKMYWYENSLLQGEFAALQAFESFNLRRVESLPRNLKKERIISPMAIMAEDFDSNFPKKKSKKNSTFGQKIQKSTKLALNPNPIKIRGFLCNFRPIWAISSPMESLESLESCSRIWNKIPKKSNFWSKNSKMGSKSIKLALNPDPIEIGGFFNDFGSI